MDVVPTTTTTSNTNFPRSCAPLVVEGAGQDSPSSPGIGESLEAGGLPFSSTGNPSALLFGKDGCVECSSPVADPLDLLCTACFAPRPKALIAPEGRSPLTAEERRQAADWAKTEHGVSLPVLRPERKPPLLETRRPEDTGRLRHFTAWSKRPRVDFRFQQMILRPLRDEWGITHPGLFGTGIMFGYGADDERPAQGIPMPNGRPFKRDGYSRADATSREIARKAKLSRDDRDRDSIVELLLSRASRHTSDRELSRLIADTNRRRVKRLRNEVEEMQAAANAALIEAVREAVREDGRMTRDLIERITANSEEKPAPPPLRLIAGGAY